MTVTQYTHNHSNFNRQELFTKDDIDLVMNIILDLDPTNKPLLNMLYGLFDVYLYHDIDSAVQATDDVSQDMKVNFSNLIHKIKI